MPSRVQGGVLAERGVESLPSFGLFEPCASDSRDFRIGCSRASDCCSTRLKSGSGCRHIIDDQDSPISKEVRLGHVECFCNVELSAWFGQVGLSRGGCVTSKRPRIHGLPHDASHASSKQGCLIVAPKREAEDMERNGYDSIDCQPDPAACMPKQVTEWPRQIGTVVILEVANCRRESATECAQSNAAQVTDQKPLFFDVDSRRACFAEGRTRRAKGGIARRA